MRPAVLTSVLGSIEHSPRGEELHIRNGPNFLGKIGSTTVLAQNAVRGVSTHKDKKEKHEEKMRAHSPTL